MLVPRNVAAVTNKLQRKTLVANFTTTNATITDLTFNNLVVGKTYELTGQITFALDAGANDDNIEISILNGATQIGISRVQIGAPDASTDVILCNISIPFVATATTVTFFATDVSANSYVIGNNTTYYTFVNLKQLNDTEITTAFT